MKRIYLSPSNQEHNAGVAGYGIEEVRMHEFASRHLAPLLRLRGMTVRISEPQWDMDKVVGDSNNWGADAHICIHTNAGGGRGAVGFYGSEAGRKLTATMMQYLSKVTPASDVGVKSWPGLYEVRWTRATCAYLELFFHDSAKDVTHYLAHKDDYAEALAHGVCDFYKLPWELEPEVDYLPLKVEALKVAQLLSIPAPEVTLTHGKGTAFENLLRQIADK